MFISFGHLYRTIETATPAGYTSTDVSVPFDLGAGTAVVDGVTVNLPADLVAELAAQQAARLEREANEADKAARIQALAAKSVSDLEASAGQIDGRAAVYEAFPDVATNGQAVTRINVISDDVAALARRVADLQRTVAHLIRLTVIDNS